MGSLNPLSIIYLIARCIQNDTMIDTKVTIFAFKLVMFNFIWLALIPHVRASVSDDFDYKSFAVAFNLGEADDDCSGECCQCVASGSQWYMDKLKQKLDAYCKDTKCPFIKEMCDAGEKHPRITLGFLLDHGHTASTSFAYCAGKGLCNLPESSTQVESRRMQEVPELEGLEGCVMKTMMKVMEKASSRFIHWCSTTKSARALRMCKWGLDDAHKGESLGMLISRTQPWKYAIGRCY